MSKEQLGSLIEQLNAATKAERLAALTAIRKLVDSGDIPQPARGKDVNNHIHTFYSFSPYSPAKAVYRSWAAGLATTGIMDHDSISGAEEFVEAGRIMGIATTVGADSARPSSRWGRATASPPWRLRSASMVWCSGPPKPFKARLAWARVR